MSVVHLICGKICSGKSFYAKTLAKRENAVVLSCDDLSLSLFPPLMGDEHEEVMARVKKYLHERAEDILKTGTAVILEWGFWKRADRERTQAFYEDRGFSVRWHYIDADDGIIARSIEKRNAQVLSGRERGYYVDTGLFEKMTALIEAPADDELGKNWSIVTRKNI